MPLGRCESAIRWVVYPVLLGGALALLWALLVFGASLAWAPYIAVAIAGPLVISPGGQVWKRFEALLARWPVIESVNS